LLQAATSAGNTAKKAAQPNVQRHHSGVVEGVHPSSSSFICDYGL